jgi:hypothetical protein
MAEIKLPKLRSNEALEFVEHTQKNGMISKVDKKFIPHPTWVQHTLSPQQKLSKFLLRYQQFASHAC